MNRPTNRSIDSILAEQTDHCEDRQMLVALAAAELAIDAFKVGADVFDGLPDSDWLDDDCHARTAREISARIEPNLDADVTDTVKTLTFFHNLLVCTTGLRPDAEFVAAMRSIQPVRALGCATLRGVVEPDELTGRVRRVMDILWPVQLAMFWVDAAVAALNDYTATLDKVTTVPPAEVAAVSIDCVSRIITSMLIESEYTGGDLTPFMEWAGIKFEAPSADDTADEADEAITVYLAAI